MKKQKGNKRKERIRKTNKEQNLTDRVPKVKTKLNSNKQKRKPAIVNYSHRFLLFDGYGNSWE
ncbi:MAG: hypothetical protein JNL63_13430 [Bacteroidia bacterium]|nr:hypothetical protein [Bacteroidia bacterium]